MTTIGLSYSLVKRSTKCAPALGNFLNLGLHIVANENSECLSEDLKKSCKDVTIFIRMRSE